MTIQEYNHEKFVKVKKLTNEIQALRCITNIRQFKAVVEEKLLEIIGELEAPLTMANKQEYRVGVSYKHVEVSKGVLELRECPAAPGSKVQPTKLYSCGKCKSSSALFYTDLTCITVICNSCNTSGLCSIFEKGGEANA